MSKLGQKLVYRWLWVNPNIFGFNENKCLKICMSTYLKVLNHIFSTKTRGLWCQKVLRTGEAPRSCACHKVKRLVIILLLSIQLFSEMVSRRDMNPTPFDGKFTPDYRNALDFENSKPFENCDVISKITCYSIYEQVIFEVWFLRDGES